MSERTAFAVVNKRGKVVEYTSRIPYQYGQVFYKGNVYQLKNPLPDMKAKKIIVLGTGYPVSHKKAIMKGGRKPDYCISGYRNEQPKTTTEMMSNLKSHTADAGEEHIYKAIEVDMKKERPKSLTEAKRIVSRHINIWTS